MSAAYSHEQEPPLDEGAVTIVLPVLEAASVPSALGTIAALASNCPESREFDLVVVLPDLGPAAEPLEALSGDVSVVRVPAGSSYGAAVVSAARTATSEHLLLAAPGVPCLWVDIEGALDGHEAPRALAVVPRGGVLSCADAVELARSPLAVRALTRLVSAGPTFEPRATGAAAAGDGGDPTAEPGLVSVVVLAPSGAEAAQATADLLHHYTRPRHEVLVVDTTGRGPQRRLGNRPWCRVVPAGGLSPVAAVNTGLQAAHGSHVVVLDETCSVSRFWADGLLAALEPDVAAVGARCHGAQQPQGVMGTDYHDVAGFRRFAEQWRQRSRGAVREVDALVAAPALVAVDALERVGLLDDGFRTLDAAVADLALRLRAAGYGLRVADEVYVHRDEGDPAPREWKREAGTALPQEASRRDRRRLADRWGWAALPDSVTACLIVKDEQDMLPGCLASLVGLVDEVVVADTGSADRTVEVARAVGAQVVRVPWTDDFAAARNAATAFATATWVLQIDADELLHCRDDEVLRRVLGTDLDLVHLEILDFGEDARGAVRVDSTRRYPKLFRRDTCHYVHRIHEQVQLRRGEGPREAWSDALCFQHFGYLQDVFASKGKSARNHQLAQVRRDEVGPEESWQSVYELGRAQFGVGEHDEAERNLRDALEQMPVCNFWFTAHELLVALCEKSGRRDEALDLAARAGGQDPLHVQAALTHARLLGLDGRTAAARAVLRALYAGTTGAARAEAAVALAEALVESHDRRDTTEAYAMLLPLALDSPGTFTGWSPLLRVLPLAGHPDDLADLIGAPPPELLRALIAADSETRGRCLEVLFPALAQAPG